MPKDCQANIFTKFLFKDLFQCYYRYFLVMRTKNGLVLTKKIFQRDMNRYKKIFQNKQKEDKLDSSIIFNHKRLNNEPSNRYLELMILQKLEPFYCEPGQIFINYDEHSTLITFFLEGNIDVGFNCQNLFEIFNLMHPKYRNDQFPLRKIHKKHIFQYPMSIGPGQVVGFYEILQRCSSQFNYRVSYKNDTCQYSCLTKNYSFF